MTARVSLMMPCWNRLEFTREAFSALLSSTEWGLVSELTVYDVGSTDGTREWLTNAVREVPTRAQLVPLQRTLVADVMARHIGETSGELIAKIDNDTMVPPGWLMECVRVLDQNQGVSLLGIEAMFRRVHPAPFDTRRCVKAEFVGGIGVWRRSAFSESKPFATKAQYGWQDWQIKHRSAVPAWLDPCLPVFLLDRMPTEPWKSLSEKYERLGWQRPWPKYPPMSQLWDWRWKEGA